MSDGDAPLVLVTGATGYVGGRLAPREGGRSELKPSAVFAPRGLPGLLYWRSLHLVHGVIFSRMPRRIVERAETA